MYKKYTFEFSDFWGDTYEFDFTRDQVVDVMIELIKEDFEEGNIPPETYIIDDYGNSHTVESFVEEFLDELLDPNWYYLEVLPYFLEKRFSDEMTEVFDTEREERKNSR